MIEIALLLGPQAAEDEYRTYDYSRIHCSLFNEAGFVVLLNRQEGLPADLFLKARRTRIIRLKAIPHLILKGIRRAGLQACLPVA